MLSDQTQITQIGLVIRDEARIKANMKQYFGVTPSRERFIRGDETRRYYGVFEDFEAKLIYYNFGSIEIEYIVPYKGHNIWQDHLDAHGEGLHHIQIAVKDSDEAAEELVMLGTQAVQEGATVSKIHDAKWKYFDTQEQLGFILEVFDGAAKAQQ